MQQGKVPSARGRGSFDCEASAHVPFELGDGQGQEPRSKDDAVCARVLERCKSSYRGQLDHILRRHGSLRLKGESAARGRVSEHGEGCSAWGQGDGLIVTEECAPEQ